MNVRAKATVRLEPDKKAEKLGVVYPRNQLVAYATSGKWTKAQFGAKLGYVETKYLTQAKQPIIRDAISKREPNVFVRFALFIPDFWYD